MDHIIFDIDHLIFDIDHLLFHFLHLIFVSKIASLKLLENAHHYYILKFQQRREGVSRAHSLLNDMSLNVPHCQFYRVKKFNP